MSLDKDDHKGVVAVYIFHLTNFAIIIHIKILKENKYDFNIFY